MGSNDYINNYFVPNNYSTSRTYTTDQFATVLVRQYSQQLMVHDMLIFPFDYCAVIFYIL